MTVTIEVLSTVWGAGDPPVEFRGGEHVLDGSECACGDTHPKPDAAMLRLLAGADAAGTIRVLDATAAQLDRMGRAVQSQEDGEAAQARALGDWVEPVSVWEDDGTKTLVAPGYWTGPWQHGNLVQAVLDREARLAAGAHADGERETLEAELDQLRARLAETEEPS